ncbi:MAG: hypothetical protein OIF35_13420, partial [Cellvibrionaceae bacterium]|nr:hypothetical protein [Cellvibrionaceae bacterium]
PGLPTGGELSERLLYIHNNIGLWHLGWSLWMASALGLLLFATMLSHYLPAGPMRRYALLILALGIAPDLTAEVIYAFIIPKLNPAELSLIGSLEILAVHLTGFLGNGLYNVGGLLLNILLLKSLRERRWIAWAGLPAWSLGLGLSAAIASDNIIAAELLTGAAMVLSTTWMLLIALTLFRRNAIPQP